MTQIPSRDCARRVGPWMVGNPDTLAKPKPRIFAWPPSAIIRQELQRHKSTELHILGLVDHTHSAAAELFEDAVVGNGLADELGRTIGVNVTDTFGEWSTVGVHREGARFENGCQSPQCAVSWTIRAGPALISRKTRAFRFREEEALRGNVGSLVFCKMQKIPLKLPAPIPVKPTAAAIRNAMTKFMFPPVRRKCEFRIRASFHAIGPTWDCWDPTAGWCTARIRCSDIPHRIAARQGFRSHSRTPKPDANSSQRGGLLSTKSSRSAGGVARAS